MYNFKSYMTPTRYSNLIALPSDPPIHLILEQPLDYLLLEITMPLIIYIWRRHGGTCKFVFEFYWDVKHLFYDHVTTS